MRSGSTGDQAPLKALAGLGLVAVGLALIGLGDLPLRDFDEATVARVAFELRHGLGEAPLLPTLWNQPYLNKAPGLHSLIALMISATTQPDQLPSEWTIRLAPALLSCLVVPLGGWLQWTLRPGDRSSAITTSVILLTLLPVARHGRLAMLDGSQLTAMALLWLALLQLNRSRCSGLWGTVAGLMASAMLLLKAPLLVPAVVAAGLALIWGQEWATWNNRATACIGMLLGLAPGMAWHLWHAHIRGTEALWLWGGDGAGRVLLDAGEGSDLGWRVPVIEVLEGLAPAAAGALRPDLGLAMAPKPLGTVVPGLPAHLGRVYPSAAHPAPGSHLLWLPWLSSALRCWSGWWSALLLFLFVLTFTRQLKPPLPPAATATSLLLVWARLMLLLLWLGSFSSIGYSLAPYRGLAAVLGLGWCWGGWWLRSAAPQRRRLGVISLSCGTWQRWRCCSPPCGCGSSTKPGPCNRLQPSPSQSRSCVNPGVTTNVQA